MTTHVTGRRSRVGPNLIWIGVVLLGLSALASLYLVSGDCFVSEALCTEARARNLQRAGFALLVALSVAVLAAWALRDRRRSAQLALLFASATWLVVAIPVRLALPASESWLPYELLPAALLGLFPGPFLLLGSLVNLWTRRVTSSAPN